MASADQPMDTCEELRCACGSLVARLVPAGVELRCRRCKRRIVLPLEAPAPAGAQVP